MPDLIPIVTTADTPRLVSRLTASRLGEFFRFGSDERVRADPCFPDLNGTFLKMRKHYSMILLR
jgi:hypothetical protein